MSLKTVSSDLVALDLLDHQVFTGEGALSAFFQWLSSAYGQRKIAVLCDENTVRHCFSVFSAMCPREITLFPLVIQSGEEYKTMDTAMRLWRDLSALQMERGDLLVNLGGGVVCDLGGFVAATYLRGIPFVHVPTSLLAQVDAAIGGKTGVDLDGMKNRVGLTVFPEAVYCFPGFMKTLPAIEWKSALAEVLKHALVKDAALWSLLQEGILTNNRVMELLPQIQQVKVEVVKEDPQEKGVRKMLNFGHTVGHAYESACVFSRQEPVPHGFAVALGMLVETDISVEVCGLKVSEADEISNMITSVFGEMNLQAFTVEELMQWMRYDKKNRNGVLQFSLLKSIGVAVVNQQVPDGLVIDTLRKFGAQ
jgi:3-dehydroquinate synthase